MQKPDFKLIELDQTEYWDQDFLKEIGVEKVTQVYLYDANRAYHLCEMTPSYELEPLYTNVYENEETAADENARERAYSAVIEHETYDVVYMHCHLVDRLEAPKYDCVAVEDHEIDLEGDDEDERYKEIFDEYMEHYRGNCML